MSADPKAKIFALDGSEWTLNVSRLAIFVVERARTGNDVAAIQRAGLQHPMYDMADSAELILCSEEGQLAVAICDAIVKILPVDVDKRSVTADVEGVFAAALNKGDHRAAISAKKLLADIHGLVQTKIEVTHKNLEDMSDAELAEIVSGKDGATAH